jgi:hypothetical protein
MDATLIVTIYLAIAAGLGTIAIALPKAYKKLWPVIMALMILVAAGLTAWSAGLDEGHSLLMKLLDPGKLKDAEALVKAAKPPIYIYTYGIWIGGAYLMLLDWLAGHSLREKAARET